MVSKPPPAVGFAPFSAPARRTSTAEAPQRRSNTTPEGLVLLLRDEVEPSVVRRTDLIYRRPALRRQPLGERGSQLRLRFDRFGYHALSCPASYVVCLRSAGRQTIKGCLDHGGKEVGRDVAFPGQAVDLPNDGLDAVPARFNPALDARVEATKDDQPAAEGGENRCDRGTIRGKRRQAAQCCAAYEQDVSAMLLQPGGRLRCRWSFRFGGKPVVGR